MAVFTGYKTALCKAVVSMCRVLSYVFLKKYYFFLRLLISLFVVLFGTFLLPIVPLEFPFSLLLFIFFF